MPLHDTANILAKGSGPDATAVARRKASLLKKQRQLRRELRTLQDQSAKDLVLLEKERQELRDGRLNAAASHAAKKGLAQKPRSSRDRAEFDARTLKVEAPRAEQAAKRAEARCSLALPGVVASSVGTVVELLQPPERHHSTLGGNMR